MIDNNRFDAYALYVCKNGEENSIYSENVDEDTFFDVASMGKVLVTATLALHAISKNKLNLHGKISEYLDNVPYDKKDITIENLLLHTSGIVRRHIEANTLSLGKEEIERNILLQPLAFLPKKGYEYSCTGYILLGFILEKIYGASLDRLYKKLIQKPLELDGCVFNLLPKTENYVVGYYTENHNGCLVADKIANAMKGIAGNGGSFWNMKSLKKYVQAVVNKDKRLYKESLFDLAEQDFTPYYSEGRGLGWIMVDERYDQTGKLFKNGSFGHCGNTGASFFINREQKLSVILLTNATRFAYMRRGFTCSDYDEMYGEVVEIRKAIHNAILEDFKNEGLV